MKFIIIFISLVPFVLSAYVPGTPGAPWDDDEIQVVKEKINVMLDDPVRVLRMIPSTPVGPNQSRSGRQIYSDYRRIENNEASALSQAVIPNQAKLLRLAFHDCLKDSESGGCNGCLNFQGMGVLTPGRDSGCAEDQSCPMDDPPKKGDNNNMMWIAIVLEKLYMEENFIDGEPMPRGSLYETGKSRADLWHFATLVAVESAANAHIASCESNEESQCSGPLDESSKCKYTLPPLEFTTGRKDCIPSCTGWSSAYKFCTTATEVHPDPHGNGEETAKFFKDNFNFNKKQTVAIMGGHSLGHANERISGFKHYPWEDAESEFKLSNRYYNMLAKKKNYRKLLDAAEGAEGEGQCSPEISAYSGDEEGKPVRISWMVRSEGNTNSGGVWNWNPFIRKCDPAKCDSLPTPFARTSCCLHPDLAGEENQGTGPCDGNDGDPDEPCPNEAFMQMSYTNVDMGLAMNFNTDDKGRPVSCRGMNSQDWLNNEAFFSQRTRCPKNRSMFKFVRRFANNGQAWINSFVPTMSKMMKNGYNSEDLTNNGNI